MIRRIRIRQENGMEKRHIETDILIIGGGTAGCFAAYTLGKITDCRITVAEKANIERSGCLAAGVNALNAYITEGRKPEDYVAYARADAHGIVREDLLLSMSRRLNQVTEDLERLGLVILKDEKGRYVPRGNRNIKINGENIKPILAKAARKGKGVKILNHVNITDYAVHKNRILGAFGFDVDRDIFYEIEAKAVICASGGASGLYRPNNPGFSRHKMWYCPFNTGAGYAMGLLAGAEMTTFEMRFIALRCKDTIAPVGTIAQGVGARQMNARGEIYETKYGLTTSQRVFGAVQENREGRGPCYLNTRGITKEQEQELYRAYLNMAPSQTLKWLEAGNGPSEENVEVEGTEPYIVGGHTASGYWVDSNRETTVKGLFAAGDVAGGCPQKYVTGALAEAQIAAEAAAEYLKRSLSEGGAEEEALARENGEYFRRISVQKHREYEGYLKREQAEKPLLQTDQLEEAMQKVMDEYAGGISTGYQYSEAGLHLAEKKIRQLQKMAETLPAADTDELLRIYELRERLIVCRGVIAHLLARKETRWHSFGENADYPERKDDWLKFVNSRMDGNGNLQIIYRELMEEGKQR